MPPRALEDDVVVVQLVNEQPVRFKMALAPILVVALQRVFARTFRQRFFVDQRCLDLFELLDVFPATLEQTQIALKLGGIVGRAHQIPNRANMSCAFSQGTMFSPASVSANVRSVTALGMRTSKGKPRLSLTC